MAAPDFERAVLGAVLLNPTHCTEIAVLRPNDFLLESHRKIFRCMRDLGTDSQPIDPLTLVNKLKDRKELDAVGGAGYVSGLMDGLPDRPLESVRHYVGEVRRFAGLRRIAQAAESIREQAANDPAATIADLRRHFSEAERDAAGYEAEQVNRITRAEDIPDPFACESDEIGWVVSGLIPARGITIIAGEAGAGKTWLALALARATTVGGNFLGRRTSPKRVLYLDRENPLSVIRERLQVLFGGPSDLRPWGLWCQEEPPLIGDQRLLEFARTEPVLIIDSMIRFHRADENSATQMALVMPSHRELATVSASLVVLHHKAKGDTSSYRGSSDIVAGADVAFSLLRRNVLLELRTIKNRFAVETSVKIKANFWSGEFAVVDTPELNSASEVDRLADVIHSSPGLTQNEVIKQCGIQRGRAIELLHGLDGKQWHRRKGTNRSQLYFPPQVVPNGIVVGSSRNHNAHASESSSGPDSNWREPLGITQVVPVFPPLMGGNREPLEFYGT